MTKARTTKKGEKLEPTETALKNIGMFLSDSDKGGFKVGTKLSQKLKRTDLEGLIKNLNQKDSKMQFKIKSKNGKATGNTKNGN